MRVFSAAWPLLRFVALFATLALASDTSPKAGAPSGAAPRFGFYFIDFRTEAIERQLMAMTDSLGAAPHYVLTYRDLGHPFSTRTCKMMQDHGASPVIAMELWQWHAPDANQLPSIAAGSWDDYFRQWATDAKACGDTIYLRFGFEMNGNWFSWGNHPEQFIAAWRHVHDIFREVGASNVLWVFCPNEVSVPDTPENAIPKYWPGDEYVDWLGVDGYNFGEHHDRWHHWQSFDEIFDPTLDLYAKERPNLPVLIGEFGCAPGEPGRKSQWIRDAARSLRARPQVKGAIWFDFDKRREGEPDWCLEHEPGAIAAFRESFVTQ